MNSLALPAIPTERPRFFAAQTGGIVKVISCASPFAESRLRCFLAPFTGHRLPHPITRNNIPEALLTSALRRCISSTIVPTGSVLPACSMFTFDIP